MKYLKYFLLAFILFLTPNVLADTTYDMTSRITSPVNYSECGAGSYTGVELNGSTNCWNTNTRYQGTLSRIYFNLPAPTGSVFDSDTAYRLSIYMATNDWRNRFGTVVVSPGSSYANNFVDTFSFVSRKQINITFTVPYGGSTTYQSLWVNLPATNTNTLITGETNWNLNKVTLTKLTSGSGGGSTTPSGPSTSFDDTAIINNANENTQDIINNNNQNTQDIITNNNENTDKIVDTIEKKCSNLLDSKNFSRSSGINSNSLIATENGITITGTTNQTASNYVAYDLSVTPNTDYHLSVENNTNTFIVFTTNYTTIARAYSGTTSLSFNSGNNETLYFLFYANGTTATTYNKIMLTKDNSPFCVYGSSSNRLDETNSFLTDDSDPSISDNTFLSTFNSISFNDPLGYLLTLPTQLINKIVSLSSTCTSINLGILYGVMLTMPCINLENILGSTLWGTIDVIFSVTLLVVIFKNLYDTFSNLLTMGAQKEAKEKFSMPTPMDFLAIILGGDR